LSSRFISFRRSTSWPLRHCSNIFNKAPVAFQTLTLVSHSKKKNYRIIILPVTLPDSRKGTDFSGESNAPSLSCRLARYLAVAPAIDA
jgi:hypothetical protein